MEKNRLSREIGVADLIIAREALPEIPIEDLIKVLYGGHRLANEQEVRKNPPKVQE